MTPQEYKEKYGTNPFNDWVEYAYYEFDIIELLKNEGFEMWYRQLQKISDCRDIKSEYQGIVGDGVGRKLFEAVKWLSENRRQWCMMDFFSVLPYDLQEKAWCEIPTRSTDLGTILFLKETVFSR